MKITKIFGKVDDYQVLFDAAQPVKGVVNFFTDCLYNVVITHELPVNNVIQFLDLRLSLLDDHVCWEYHPRDNKMLFPYHSSFSKLIKRAIENLCFSNALRKSCAEMCFLVLTNRKSAF